MLEKEEGQATDNTVANVAMAGMSSITQIFSMNDEKEAG